MYQIYLLVVFIVFMIIFIIPKQKYVIGNSSIHGKGIICVHSIKKDESIGIVITRENNIVNITPYLGQYVNHKVDENTYLKKVENNGIDTYYLHAKKNIYFGEEITSNYDGPNIPDFIEKSKPEYV
jgi:hypothetical protein